MRILKKTTWLAAWALLAAIGGTTYWMMNQYPEIEESRHAPVDLSMWQFPLSSMTQSLNHDLLQAGLEEGEVLDLSSLFELPRPLTGQEYAQVNDQQPNAANQYNRLQDEERYERSQEIWVEAAAARMREHQDLFQDFRNIQYFALDHETGRVLYNEPGLQDAAQGQPDQAQLEQDFQDVMVFEFDENGQLSLLFSFERDRLRLNMANPSYLEFWPDTFSTDEPGQWLAPRSMTFAFAIPRQLSYHDTVSWQLNQSREWGIRDALLLRMLLGFAFAGTAAFVLPVHALKKNKGWKAALKLPLELTAVSVFPVFFFLTEEVPKLLAESFSHGMDITFQPLATYDNLYFLVNLAVWFLAFTYMAYLVIYVKNLFLQGFWQSLTRNTIIIGLPYGIYRFAVGITLERHFIGQLLTFFGLKTLMMAVAVFLMAIILGDEGILFLGWLGVVIYMGAAFMVTLKLLSKYRADYIRCLNLTKKMATQGLDVETSRSFGVFASLERELMSLKDQVKTAIHEEVSHEKKRVNTIILAAGEMGPSLEKVKEAAGYLRHAEMDLELRDGILAELEGSADDLQRLAEDLYEAGSASIADFHSPLVETEVTGLIGDALFQLEGELVKAGIALRTTFPEDPVRVLADPARLERVLKQLTSNLAQHALAGTRAYITVATTEKQATIIFRNMSKEEFQPGSELSLASQLELNTLRNLMELQGGTFQLQVDGDLFKVVLTLPLVQ